MAGYNQERKAAKRGRGRGKRARCVTSRWYRKRRSRLLRGAMGEGEGDADDSMGGDPVACSPLGIGSSTDTSREALLCLHGDFPCPITREGQRADDGGKSIPRHERRPCMISSLLIIATCEASRLLPTSFEPSTSSNGRSSPRRHRPFSPTPFRVTSPLPLHSRSPHPSIPPAALVPSWSDRSTSPA